MGTSSISCPSVESCKGIPFTSLLVNGQGSNSFSATTVVLHVISDFYSSSKSMMSPKFSKILLQLWLYSTTKENRWNYLEKLELSIDEINIEIMKGLTPNLSLLFCFFLDFTRYIDSFFLHCKNSYHVLFALVSFCFVPGCYSTLLHP